MVFLVELANVVLLCLQVIDPARCQAGIILVVFFVPALKHTLVPPAHNISLRLSCLFLMSGKNWRILE